MSPTATGTSPTLDEVFPERVILTTYPNQAGSIALPLCWGADTAQARGPLIVSRQAKSLKARNAIGAYGGSYSVYRAIACANGQLNCEHRPDFHNTEPPFEISPNPSWFDASKIVSMDPWGHISPHVFRSYLEEGYDIRPTNSCTKAHIKMSEIDQAVAAGTIPIDGKIVRQSMPLPGALPGYNPGVEVTVSKAAVDPVWHLPGVARRLGISENVLRRSLFEHTGGMYSELLTRPDIQCFLPPISGATVYIFGNIKDLQDESKEVTVRVHDECNGSDVFGSDICTCRPYLIFGIEEAIKTAQRGGAGCVIYFRKEGRALGEVTKYLVYNARKRGEDVATNYFKRTEDIAGVKDMRFQALMPDILHWLGIKHITNMISMSDMKYDAIVDSGIPIKNRYEIPAGLIPADSQVEIDAKIFAGYFSATRALTAEELTKTVGRSWEDVNH